MDIKGARSILERGDLADAEAAYRQLLKDPAQQSDAMYGLGFIYYKKRNLTSAEYWFNEELKVNPDSQNSLYFLGEIAASRHNHDAAAGLFAKVLTLNPRHASALRRLTQVAEAMGPGPGRASIPQPGIPVAPATPPRRATRPPRAPSSSRSIIGIAGQVRLQVVPFNGQPAAKQSLTFRVAVMGRNGHPQRTVAVEMRSFRIQGNVENGDWVEIAKVSRSGKVTSFRNLSTGGQVRTRLW